MKPPEDLVNEFRARRKAEREQRERDELADTIAESMRLRGMKPEAGFNAVAIEQIRRGGKP